MSSSASGQPTVTAGRDIHEAVGGATRIHSGQAIGILAGAIKPGDKAEGKGLTIISGKDPIKYQAQGGKMQVAAKDDLSIQSKSKHVDWASAKSITIANSAGASIKIEGGNVTLECPGTISILAGTKSFVGPQKTTLKMPTFAQSDGLCTEQVSFVTERESHALADFPFILDRPKPSWRDVRESDAKGTTTQMYSDQAEPVHVFARHPHIEIDEDQF